MAEIGQKLMWLVQVAQFNMHYILSIIAVLWITQVVNFLLRYRLNVFGLLPRHPMGLIGIFTSPFLHGSFTHLLFNCIPLFLLMNLLLLAGLDQFIVISLLIIVISGLCVWLVGRPALHVGASGLIMGYWGYLMINAILYPSIITVLLIIFCFYYFAGLFASLLPKEGTSWEGHIFGFLSGLLVSYMNLPAYFSSPIVG
ncbi:MAG: rhomboid family intramembrane serine protease [Gammaproteobacteria bacterium]|nr:rhomboid family intramembrane serine protease [Gammaproteobacteria bacterium]MCD8543260.1 rhomboid family intramembrane serine protease [Gammaproteobacteria bacterium]